MTTWHQINRIKSAFSFHSCSKRYLRQHTITKINYYKAPIGNAA